MNDRRHAAGRIQGPHLEPITDVPSGRLQRILAELADGADAWSAARLCLACPGIVQVDGAGVMLMSGDIPRGSLCTSNEVSHLIEELQYTLGEGPCFDAYTQDTVVTEPDLAHPVTHRWPAFSAPALAAGVRAVFGFPLRVGTVRLGALNLYRTRIGLLGAEQYANALVMADIAARWVLEAQAARPRTRWLRSWRSAPISISSCTTRPASSRSRRGSASLKRSSGCGPTPSATAACSPTWPAMSSRAGSGWDESRPGRARRSGQARG